MMKKKFAVGIALLLVLTCWVQPVFAQESEVTVEFTEGSGVVDPLDPDDPTNPLIPGGGGGLGGVGSLVLNYASTIAFGPQTIISTEQVYHALTLKPFVQVTDVRGTGTGWELRATLGVFTQVDKTLPGAFLTLTGGEAVSATVGVAAPTPAQNIILQADGETDELIFSAARDTGMGTWLCRWYPSPQGAGKNDNVTLTIPASVAQLGSYTSTVTWSLINAP